MLLAECHRFHWGESEATNLFQDNKAFPLNSAEVPDGCKKENKSICRVTTWGEEGADSRGLVISHSGSMAPASCTAHHVTSSRTLAQEQRQHSGHRASMHPVLEGQPRSAVTAGCLKPPCHSMHNNMRLHHMFIDTTDCTGAKLRLLVGARPKEGGGGRGGGCGAGGAAHQQAA